MICMHVLFIALGNSHAHEFLGKGGAWFWWSFIPHQAPLPAWAWRLLSVARLLGKAEDVQRTRVSAQGQPAKIPRLPAKDGGLGGVRERRSQAERIDRAE